MGVSSHAAWRFWSVTKNSSHSLTETHTNSDPTFMKHPHRATLHKRTPLPFPSFFLAGAGATVDIDCRRRTSPLVTSPTTHVVRGLTVRAAADAWRFKSEEQADTRGPSGDRSSVLSPLRSAAPRTGARDFYSIYFFRVPRGESRALLRRLLRKKQHRHDDHAATRTVDRRRPDRRPTMPRSGPRQGASRARSGVRRHQRRARSRGFLPPTPSRGNTHRALSRDLALFSLGNCHRTTNRLLSFQISPLSVTVSVSALFDPCSSANDDVFLCSYPPPDGRAVPSLHDDAAQVEQGTLKLDSITTEQLIGKFGVTETGDLHLRLTTSKAGWERGRGGERGGGDECRDGDAS